MANDTRSSSNEANKLRTYRLFKHNHQQEHYVTLIKDPYIRSSVTKLRLSAHSLMIEKGRHLRIDVNQRICPKCTLGEIENEMHAVIYCPASQTERSAFFGTLEKQFPEWPSYTDTQKFNAIMTLSHNPILTSQYIHKLLNPPPHSPITNKTQNPRSATTAAMKRSENA